MSKPTSTPGEVIPVTALRTYPTPWKGSILLVCRKCQKKLRHHNSPAEVANIKKALKQRRTKGTPSLRVIQVPCLKLCPKDAVTVCTQHQLAQGLCSIIRTSADLDALYRGEAIPLPTPEV